MKIKIPTSWAQITVQQWMDAERAKDDRFEVVGAVSNLTAEELRSVSEVAMAKAHNATLDLLSQKPSRLYREIKVNDEVLAFIPHWEDFTAGEFADAEFFASNLETDAHRFLAVMYRRYDPKSRYRKRLEPYSTPDNAEAFRTVPADVLGGCFLFFYLIDEHYRNSTLQSLAAAALAKSRPNMGGITRSTSWLAKMRQKWTKWKNGLSTEH